MLRKAKSNQPYLEEAKLSAQIENIRPISYKTNEKKNTPAEMSSSNQKSRLQLRYKNKDLDCPPIFVSLYDFGWITEPPI